MFYGSAYVASLPVRGAVSTLDRLKPVDGRTSRTDFCVRTVEDRNPA